MSLQNFEKARESMVVSQLEPSGVVSETVGDLFRKIPREMFVPNHLRGVCYLDDDIPLGNGRVLMEPLILAKMLQDSGLSKSSKVLDVGAGTGYGAAILSQNAGEVVALDMDEKLLHTARQNWENLGLKNISPVIGHHREGYATGSPYDAIFIEGAVTEIPEKLIAQLKKGGKLYCVLVPKDSPCGQIVSLVKDDRGHAVKTALSDAMTGFLAGMEPPEKFEF